MMQVDEALKEFLVESYENLDQLDRDFVALEADPGSPERIGGIFRTIHTIKGTSGFFGFSKLEELTHAGESLLVQLRDGRFALTPPLASLLLEMVDIVRGMLKSIESDGTEGAPQYGVLLGHLRTAVETGEAPAVAPRVSAAPASAAPVSAARASVAPPMAAAAGGGSSGPYVTDDGAFMVVSMHPLPMMGSSRASKPPSIAPPPRLPSVRPAPHLRSVPPPPPEPPSVAMAPAPAMPAAPAEAPKAAPPKDDGSSVSDSNVRVDVGLLDKLMNLVGELVLARNQILQFGVRVEDPAFIGASQRINTITTELQENVMKTRMQPIGNIWSKLPRIVRDVAVTCGKQVRVEMVGKDTELDRTILEAIKDPLVHVVRNAVDHGIETQDVRAARGKARTGTLLLRAYHEGGHVCLEISDDGAGLNTEAIRQRAVAKSLVTAERAAQMTDRELSQMIFVPGFSTAAKVTNVSGRGVGMDVVKTNVERIGGTVDLFSTPGQGTTLKIKIPLTLAIVPALIVTSGDQRCAIPQTSLVELVRLEGDGAKAGVELIHGAPVYRLRGQLLPLVYLDRAFDLSKQGGVSVSADGGVNIVVLQANDRQFGLVVDEVRDTEEIVVKPLGRELKSVTVFAGATIMGDGRVALILDVVGLAQHSRVLSRIRERAPTGGKQAAAAEGASVEQKQALLLFGVGENTTMALPLELVSRLEEFPRERLERVSSRLVVQYRGEILPLVDLSELVGGGYGQGDDPNTVHVIVYAEGNRRIGFMVGRILDVVEEAVHVENCGSSRGMLGAAVLQGRITELLDVRSVVAAHDPTFFDGEAA